MRDISEISDIGAESGIIGTLIYHPEYVLVTDYLKPKNFYGTENACIYWAIQELYKDGIANIDAYNLSQKLQSNPAVNKTLDKYNLPSVQEYMELYKETARHTIEEYTMLAESVVTLAFKRDLVKTFNQLESQCFDLKKDLDTLSGNVYDSLDKLTQSYITKADACLLGEEIDDVWAEIESRRTDNGLYGIPSKYPSFGEYFTYETGELVVIQAKYKQGKSVFLMNEVVHKLKNGIPTLVIDTEMQTRLYVERLLAHLTKISVQRIKSGQYTEEEGERIHEQIQWIKEQPFVHVYMPEVSNSQMYTICKMWKHKIGLQFFVFDYLKSNESESSTNYNVLGAKCDFLKNKIAGELDLAVLAACQLNRQGEVADSIKINRYLSVGIKWEYKQASMIAKDGKECGNAYAKIYVNRLGQQMQEDDEEDYIDFSFDGDHMSIIETEIQHARTDNT